MVKGAVWTLPVVALAVPAPAFAASPCDTFYPGALDWDSTQYTRASTTAGSFAAHVVGAASLTGSVRSTSTNYTLNNSTTNGYPRNLDPMSPVGGTRAAGLTLLQYANSNAASSNPSSNQTVTIHFDRPVYGLTFLLTDIDYNAAQYQDSVAISGTTNYNVTRPSGSTVIGSGTTTDPLTTSGRTNYDPNTGMQGNVQIAFSSTAPLTDVVIKYWNGLSGIGNDTNYQGIFVSNLSFGAHAPGVVC